MQLAKSPATDRCTFPLPDNNRDTQFYFIAVALSNELQKHIYFLEDLDFMSNFLAIDFNPILAPILEVLNAILWPLIGLIAAIGTVYCVFLGVKLAKSDEAGSREKAKKDLIGAIIGFVVIFVLIIALKIAVPILQDWVTTSIVA